MTGILRVNDTFFFSPICIWDWIISITYHSDIVHIFHALEIVRADTHSLFKLAQQHHTQKKITLIWYKWWLLSWDKFIINEFDKLINVNAVWPQRATLQLYHTQTHTHAHTHSYRMWNTSASAHSITSHLYVRNRKHFQWLWFMAYTTA